MSFQILMSLLTVLIFSVPSHHAVTSNPVISNVVWKSYDQGNSWQNISIGLSEKSLVMTSVPDDNGLIIASGNSVYKEDKVKGWQHVINVKKEIVDILVTGNKTFLLTYPNALLEWQRNTANTDVKFQDMVNEYIRTIHELSDGSLLMGCQYGMFKTTDKGQSWKKVSKSENVSKILEVGNTLFATSSQGLLKSTDNGNSWEVAYFNNKWMLSAEQYGKDIYILSKSMAEQSEFFIPFKNSKIDLLYSHDEGRSWNNTELSVAEDNDISSICILNKKWFCSIKNKVYQSDNAGKNWKLLKEFDDKTNIKLTSDGKVIYAMNSFVGC